MSPAIIPLSLKDAPSLIEELLPVQKLSAEAYKEQMANVGKTLTALGSYWKGRKPLILAKACVLGCLLPATGNAERDLEIFEMLMGMDDESMRVRLNLRPDAALPVRSYREQMDEAKRPEELGARVHAHIWDDVSTHLGTDVRSFPELIEQLGVMRFGHRPQVADTFCGSGQIPFEAARLGCDIYASDLNPVACMLTWGAFHIVGGSTENRERLARIQQDLAQKVQEEIERLGIENDGNGWRAKSFLYCLEVRCPQTGWLVPLLPSFVVGRVGNHIVNLLPDTKATRYNIVIRSGVTEKQLATAEMGTLRSDGRGQDPYLIHSVDGVEYRTKISTLRGDYRKEDGTNGNRLRMWEKADFHPRPDDIFQERLYCVQWMRPKEKGKGDDNEFRTVTKNDLEREHVVQDFIATRMTDWQENGWIPDMRIEPGDKTDEPIRTRGWTYWHHLFNPRQLLILGITKQILLKSKAPAEAWVYFTKTIDWDSRISRWNPRWEKTENVFYNQALNTFYNYGTRAWSFLSKTFTADTTSYPLPPVKHDVVCDTTVSLNSTNDVYITDPPYGDAVKYEEILEFFIAWLRKNPPPEFAEWVWDSRRALAITGEGEDFRREMVAAYSRMTKCMPDNGIQVIMFTHQSGSIWGDMANIVWASGLQVTAAWYIVTETNSALREGSYVKGTVLLVCRKRQGMLKTTRDDLAWEIQEEVEKQIASLTGLNQQAKGLYRDENVFEDADIQMAGYAAALRALTRYAVIDGRDMTAEATRPRVRGETTFVDSLIEFAVDTANQCLVPQGIAKNHWDRLSGTERFYLKMLEMEARGAKTLDNYQNFAKAFKVRDFRVLMGDERANRARLKSAAEFGRAEMSEGSELYQSTLRAVLYAVMELVRNMDGNEVLAHLMLNVPNYYGDLTQRELAIALADYLTRQLAAIRPEEAAAARVLSELLKNQRLG